MLGLVPLGGGVEVGTGLAGRAGGREKGSETYWLAGSRTTDTKEHLGLTRTNPRNANEVCTLIQPLDALPPR